MDNVGCIGNETRLIDCPNNGVGIHNCGHTEDAGVTCQVVTTPPRRFCGARYAVVQFVILLKINSLL